MALLTLTRSCKSCGHFHFEHLLKIYRLYHSILSIGEGKDPNNIKDVPLVKWKKAGDSNKSRGRRKENCFIYPPIKAVSDVDREGVKQMYPWTG
jgi:hypothetical protein